MEENEQPSMYLRRRTAFLQSIFVDASSSTQDRENGDGQLSREEMLARAFRFPKE